MDKENLDWNCNYLSSVIWYIILNRNHHSSNISNYQYISDHLSLEIHLLAPLICYHFKYNQMRMQSWFWAKLRAKMTILLAPEYEQSTINKANGRK
jgi:hypothetical protein